MLHVTGRILSSEMKGAENHPLLVFDYTRRTKARESMLYPKGQLAVSLFPINLCMSRVVVDRG
jgi:hypothetical protein